MNRQIATYFKSATANDLADYFIFSREVQKVLEKKGLRQYLPSAHREYEEGFRAKLTRGEVFSVHQTEGLAGVFCLSESPSEWWWDQCSDALYFSNFVVRLEAQGKGVGKRTLFWCEERARERGVRKLRLDCHAENGRLCRYYEDADFAFRGRVKQHIDYWGHL